MAGDLGLHRQVLVLNKATPDQAENLPPVCGSATTAHQHA